MRASGAGAGPASAGAPQRAAPEGGGRTGATREALITTAERLFAENGIHAVSNRSIGQAAGQGNNTVVSYHFGGKADLVAAIVRRHSADIDRRRERMLQALPARPQLRDWVECLVRPTVEHFVEQGAPTWYGRCVAQIWTDPALREALSEEALGSAALTRVLTGIADALPPGGTALRGLPTLIRVVLVHLVAECELRVAEGAGDPAAEWAATGAILVDAIVALRSGPAATP